MMKKTSLFIMILLLCKLTFAELVVNVSNPSPSIYETLNLEVSFVNQDKEQYNIEGIDNFAILSKGSTNSYNVINGKTTSMRSDMYRIRPKKSGDFTLTVVTKNGERKSIKIDVVEDSNIDSIIKDRFTLKGEIPKETYYFGEKIPFQEYFITTVNMSSFSQVKAPDFKDFSVKDITPYSRNSYIQKDINYNGKNAIELTLYKGILQANSSGEKIIKTSEVKVGEPSRDYFYENTSYLGPKDIKINIKPLPVGAPENFKGIVGTLNYEDNWKNTTVNIGQAVTLTLKLYGSGNLALVDTIGIQNSDEFNIFETEKDYSENIKGDKYYNEKTFEIAFIPKKTGLQKIPEILIPYFNTETEKYEFLKISSREIDVKGNSPLNTLGTSQESPIQNNMENSKVEKVETKNESPKKIEEVNIKLLETEKNPSRNIFKLAFGIVSLLSLVELIAIIWLVLSRRNKTKSKK